MAAEIVKIKCPQCGAILKLGLVPDLDHKKVMCSRCNFTGMVAEFQHIGENPLPAPKPRPVPEPAPGPVPAPHPGTVIDPSAKIPLVGKLRDDSGMEYPLSFGLNTVGRNAATSSAQIRITDKDSRISREHLVIEVKMPVQVNGFAQRTVTLAISDVPPVIHTVRLAKQQVNKTFLNDMLMAFGFEYNLKHGDRIRLPGDKLLTFILE